MLHTQTSLTGKRWIFRSALHATMRVMSLNDVMNLRSFPKSGMVDSWSFPDMQKICARMQTAIRNHENIGIFGDYDCDGITSTAQLVRLFRRQHTEPIVRLPHRIRDGYGIKPHHIDEFHSQGTTLLLIVDTGIGAHDAVSHAHTLGIDCIVVDHHTPKKTLPPAYGIIHPCLSQPPPISPPSAAGLTFALVSAFEGESWEGRAEDLALATIGTVADLVLLLGENRTLVQEGIHALRCLRNGPLAAFVQHVCPKQDRITGTDIAFRLAPRINAAGRMDDPLLALYALTEEGDHHLHLETMNAKRQEYTRELFANLYETIPASPPPFLINASPLYPSGIIGLLAGKLTEIFGRPSLVASIQSGICTASLRSPPCYNVTEGLERISDLLLSFGGHAQAAGCTFALQNLDKVRARLSNDVLEQTPEENLHPTLSLDARLLPSTVTLPFCSILSFLEPFGMGNPEPIFLLENVRLEHLTLIGKDRQHISGQIEGTRFVGFDLGNLVNTLPEKVDIACTIQINTWNGRTSPQIMLKDIVSYTGTSSPSISKTAVTETSKAAAIL
ncbi:hypothetical protein A3D11_01890 [Candidatus Peribacteria bacterium RIFCSPHIGHO2_02_FULL_49_16]|nr:MAG: hypothetical protein A2880_01000 [Candidatus Peribacteria bacterium RIFCSPHIGHO2_01_FULL_49_38]OGJ58667.1 MAG: hypothetical protein A3D11_01890 [Candidatus Peribacteria bacterium RIFCSPHIGHO2_02_FULL_49_16]